MHCWEKPGAKGRETLLQQDNGNRGNFGFRKGDWKLQRHDSGGDFNVKVEQKLKWIKVPKFQLFNLADDPAEKKNVIAEHPQIAEELKAELAAQIKAGRTRSVAGASEPTSQPD